MAAPSMSSVLRGILTANPALSTAEVVKKAKAAGLTQPDSTIKHNLYNIRAEFSKLTARAALPAKSVARQTSGRKPASATKRTNAMIQTKTAAQAKPSNGVAGASAHSAPLANLAGVFSNVTLVNEVVGACGGVEPTRQVAEAVRACGSLEAFLQHLDLVAALRTSDRA
jgi:hypothetical protein